MKIGLSYDLKEAVTVGSAQTDDALEEYDSPATVAAIEMAIESQGHSVIRLGGGRDFLTQILQQKVDFVFNISEGRGNYRSRESQVPCILEMLDIPYTGSDPQSLAVCLDKPLTKQLVAAAGICVPKGLVITDSRQLKEIDWAQFPLPAIVKPAYDGSSKGIRFNSRVEDGGQAASVIASLLEQYRQPILAEEFIDGDEVTVGITGNSPPKVLGVMRILPKKKGAYFVYSLEVKRDWEQLVEYECPAQLGDDVLEKINFSSLRTFELLGCRDFARIDFRISREGIPYFLEINPLAGLNPYSSDLPIMVGKLGIGYQALISGILVAALLRYPQCEVR
ncbi:MAG: ATP-grasp domain-containing protein [Dehalococcoidia bacterium]|nr:ATP-grasp domain-containing protein [Dehalococcoidia bacterium]